MIMLTSLAALALSAAPVHSQSPAQPQSAADTAPVASPAQSTSSAPAKPVEKPKPKSWLGPEAKLAGKLSAPTL